MNNKPMLHLESLEARIVMTVPTFANFTASGTESRTSEIAAGETLQLVADVTDSDSDLRRVDFYLDNGDGVYDVAIDTLLATDSDGDDGWSAIVQTEGPYRIMSLGDSITQARDPHKSYRYPLAEKLTSAGYDFDFVGSRNNADETADFDADHEGYWGWRADQVLHRLPQILDQNTPDIVLLHLGTNDSFQEQSVSSTLDDLGGIIAQLRTANPNVVVLSSLLIPSAYDWNDRITALNDELPAMVEQWHTTESPVILVDMNSAVSAETHLHDGVHPNEAVEQVMADVWLNHIRDVFPVVDPSEQFEAGDHQVFAVASDAEGNFTVNTTHFNVSGGAVLAAAAPRPATLLGINASQEIWVAQSNGRSLDTRFGGAWHRSLQFSHIATGDVNGDLIEDVVARQTNGRINVALGDGEGGFEFADWGSLTSVVAWSEFHVADFNGDGMDDIAGRAATDGTWWVGESTGHSFANSYWGRFPVSVGWNFVVGDFNGDGLQDLTGRAESDGTWWTATSSGSRFQNRYAGRWSTNVAWDDILVGDFNGDASDDLAARANNADWYIGTSQDGVFSTRYWTTWSPELTWQDVMVGDFNGDGLDDIAGRADGSWWIAQTERGHDGYAAQNRYWGYWTTATEWHDVRVMDVNGDGSDDIVGRASNGEWWTFESQSDNTFKGVFATRWAAAAQWQHIAIGPFV